MGFKEDDGNADRGEGVLKAISISRVGGGE